MDKTLTDEYITKLYTLDGKQEKTQCRSNIFIIYSIELQFFVVINDSTYSKSVINFFENTLIYKNQKYSTKIDGLVFNYKENSICGAITNFFLKNNIEIKNFKKVLFARNPWEDLIFLIKFSVVNFYTALQQKKNEEYFDKKRSLFKNMFPNINNFLIFLFSFRLKHQSNCLKNTEKDFWTNLIKMESLGPGLMELYKSLNIEIDNEIINEINLVHFIESNKKIENYQDFYKTRESIKIIEIFEKELIDLFNYKFNKDE